MHGYGGRRVSDAALLQIFCLIIPQLFPIYGLLFQKTAGIVPALGEAPSPDKRFPDKVIARLPFAYCGFAEWLRYLAKGGIGGGIFHYGTESNTANGDGPASPRIWSGSPVVSSQPVAGALRLQNQYCLAY